MAADNNFFVSLDIGSSKIVILLAEKSKEIEGQLKIFGHGIGPSAGVKKGLIVDSEKTSQAINAVVEKAYSSCNTKFFNVSVNISDPHLTIINRKGQVLIADSVITEKDVELALKSAKAVATSTNKQVINSVPNSFIIDKDPITHRGVEVDKPVGLEAKTLEANMHIVIASNQAVGSIEKSIQKSNLGTSMIVLNSMASSEPYLSQDEKDNGVCLVDIGSGVTNISVFTNGGITHSAIFKSAGDQITEEIAYAFNASFTEAERLKIQYGDAQVKSLREDQLIKFKPIGSLEECYLSSHSLVEVIEQAYLDLFSLIRQNLKSKKLDRSLKSGYVLTGAGSKTQGCDELFLRSFRVRSKLGQVDTEKIDGNEMIISDPTYACALGLLLYEPDESYLEELQPDNTVGFMGKIGKIKGNLFKF